MKYITLFDAPPKVVEPSPKVTSIVYNGYEVHFDTDFVSLTELFKASGKDENSKPAIWLRQKETKAFIETCTKKYSDLKSLYYTKRGRGDGTPPGTWAHWQIALRYAQYLNPDLAIAVNEVFKERLEELIDPELGIQRAHSRAMNTYRKQGKDGKWILTRFRGIDARKVFTDVLQKHGVSKYGYSKCTDAINTGTLGQTAKQALRSRNLPDSANLRDNLNQLELVAIMTSEIVSTDAIESKNIRGDKPCEKECHIHATAVGTMLNSFIKDHYALHGITNRN